MKEAVREYCWRKKIKPSAYVNMIVREIIESPDHFEGAPVPPAGDGNLSVWVETEDWDKALEVAHHLRTRASAMVRVAIDRDLEEEGIPYHVSTTKPKNEYIPSRE